MIAPAMNASWNPFVSANAGVVPLERSLVVVDGEPVGGRGFDWVCETLVEREPVRERVIERDRY